MENLLCSRVNVYGPSCTLSLMLLWYYSSDGCSSEIDREGEKEESCGITRLSTSDLRFLILDRIIGGVLND